MKTYNVNDNINFTQFGMTMNGNITKVVRIEEDGTGYYQVTYGPYNSRTIVATEEIEEGRFSAIVTFIREGVKHSVELCSVKEAMNYLYNVVCKNGWEFDNIVKGDIYA